MAKLDGLQAVLDFLKGLQPKIAAQLAKKVLSLNIDPLPADIAVFSQMKCRQETRLLKEAGFLRS